VAPPSARSPPGGARLAEKVARLRIFDDEAGRFDRDVLETGGQLLAVSQFTLLGDGQGPPLGRHDSGRVLGSPR
jgi:D-Tyr-tRNAtyr deacylase